MLRRNLESTLRLLARHFPVVAVNGPRQSGKTTLARAVFADKPYVSLEDPAERAFATSDPRGFLARLAGGAVFDEAQRWPDLFSYLQGMVDADRVPGRFVLSGSQQFGLLAGVTQSLAGRVGMSQLQPFARRSVRKAKDPGQNPRRHQERTLRRGRSPCALADPRRQRSLCPRRCRSLRLARRTRPEPLTATAWERRGCGWRRAFDRC